MHPEESKTARVRGRGGHFGADLRHHIKIFWMQAKPARAAKREAGDRNTEDVRTVFLAGDATGWLARTVWTLFYSLILKKEYKQQIPLYFQFLKTNQ
jgi:hypothetical protein